MSGGVRLEVDGAIATITNDNPDKHNAFDDDMDAELFGIIDQLVVRPDIRAVVWRGEGKSFSSGRDVGSIGNLKVPLSHHELMRQGHRGIQLAYELSKAGVNRLTTHVAISQARTVFHSFAAAASRRMS